MIASFLVLFAALAACQALITVKLADRLSPADTSGSRTAGAIGVGAAHAA